MQTPSDVVRAWVTAFNEADAEALADLYAPDATNHQVVREPVVGRSAIRDMFRREFAAAEMTCIVENLFEAGEWAILEWRDPGGLRGCGFFRVSEGLIRFQRGYWDRLSFLRQHGKTGPELTAAAATPGYAYIWEYSVRPDCEADFERAYGPDGPWVALFESADGYVRTELHRERGRPHRYLTIDYWESEEAWSEFRARHEAEFEAIDRRCAELTLEERELGVLEPVGREQEER